MSGDRRSNWKGPFLNGSETFFVDLRDSFTPKIGGSVSVTRADTNSHILDYQGNLINVAANEQRIHGGRRVSANNWTRKRADGTSIKPSTIKGALVSKASTNSILNFDNIDAVWSTNNINATSGAGTDIANRAALGMIADASNDLHSVAQANNNSTPDEYHAMSGLFAAGDRNFVYFRVLDLTLFQTATVWFNLSTGAVGTNSGASAAGTEFVDATIERVDGGYWCSATLVMGTGTGNASAVFGVANADNTTDFAGDNSTESLWLCALQLELNIDESLFPSMPILDTEGSTSSSSNEIVEFDSSNYTETGTIVGEFYLPYDATSLTDPASIFTFQEYDEDTNNSMRVHIAASGKLQFVVWPSTGASGGTLVETGSALTKGTWVRFAAAWTTGDFSFYVNGAAANNVVGGLNGFIPATKANVNRFYLGSRNDGTVSNHHDQFANVPTTFLKKYNTRISDADLASMSK